MNTKKSFVTILAVALVLMPYMASAGVPETLPAQVKEPTLAELQAQVNQIRIIVNDLDRRVKIVVKERAANSGYIVVGSGLSTVVAGSRAAVLADVVFDATKAAADMSVRSANLVLEAPEDGSQKGLSNCQLWDGSVALSENINPIPAKNDKVGVSFKFNSELIIPKGFSKTLKLACDVSKDPQGPAAYTWWMGQTLSKKVLLINEGSFVLEVATSSPAARTATVGAKGELAAVFDFYAAGEAVELKSLGLQIDGNPRAVSGYSMWDGSKQVGGSTLSGDNVFKAAFSSPFEIPKDGHKLLSIKIDLAEIAGQVKAGDTVSVNYNGSQGNFNLTSGVGKSSGRGMVPSTQADTVTPDMTLK